MSNERAEAVQAVVDRVASYQEGATDGTVEQELRTALAETDVEVSDDEVARMAEAIEQREEGDARIDAGALLD